MSSDKLKKVISAKGTEDDDVGLTVFDTLTPDSVGRLDGFGQETAPAPAQGPAVAPGKAGFETPPPPIAEKDIKQTVTADVVVMGAGIAGMVTALSAAEAGARVVLIEKNKKFAARGFHNAAIGSKLQKKMGIEIDTAKAIRELLKHSDNQVKEELHWIWARHSGECMDWVIDQAEAGGLKTELWAGYYKGPDYTEYPVTHVFSGGKNQKNGSNIDLMIILEQNAKKKGVDIRYNTPAAQLVREDNGRVTGVIAGTPGNYTRFAGAKGVVICTGDYSGDREMLSKYCPLAARADFHFYMPAGMNTGDGHKMALWIGAAMQKGVHAPMIHTLGGAWVYFFLHVNRNGLRYHNEDVTIQANCIAKIMQPGGIGWTLFDADFLTHVEKSLPVGGGFFWDQPQRNMGTPWTPDIDKAVLRNNLKNGTVVQADTIEELAGKMNVPASNLKATVARYNELVKKGRDEDFGKRAELLYPIEKPPFYAGIMRSAFLCMTSGLSVNAKCQVLDAGDNPIPGLYAVGNAAGDFFAVSYPTIFPGHSHGRCITFGRLVGLALAGETD
ncbi:MAG: FAD-dependent oxidoreductase [Peptococcaceae bacterium]|nr:FAD-dependent oxidoreductase [Peptococcaceae bacterium]